jgi:hypothetical protein
MAIVVTVTSAGYHRETGVTLKATNKAVVLVVALFFKLSIGNTPLEPC